MEDPERRLIIVDSAILVGEGFTEYGAQNYSQTIIDLAEKLKSDAIAVAKRRKDLTADLEVTREHVRDATDRTLGDLGKMRNGPPMWKFVVLKAVQVVTTVILSVASNNWDGGGAAWVYACGFVLLILTLFDRSILGEDR